MPDSDHGARVSPTDFFGIAVASRAGRRSKVNPRDDPPISDYALIGDTRTAALVSSSGSIDWMCVPNFDREPLFGRLLGGAESGSFAISIEGLQSSYRRYRRNSAVLETVARSETGSGQLTDGMVLDVSGKLLPQLILVRRVSCDEGTIRIRVEFDPKPGLPGRAPRSSRRAGVLVCEWGSTAIALQTAPEIDLEPGKVSVIELPAGSSLSLVMTLSDRTPVVFRDPRSRMVVTREDRQMVA